MKAVFTLLAAAILLAVTANPCFALWDIEIVSKERATELGMVVRPTAAGPNHVQVELEFKAEGKLKDFSQVDLRVGKGDDLAVAAALREDRSKPGRVAVRFTADRARLDQFTLAVWVPYRDGGLGGAVYELPLKDFVETKQAR